MKNVIIAMVLAFGLVGVSNAGECNSEVCNQPRKVVSVTRTVVRETVRLPRRVVNSCTNGVCRSRSVTVVR
jgi:hypothetical protein